MCVPVCSSGRGRTGVCFCESVCIEGRLGNVPKACLFRGVSLEDPPCLPLPAPPPPRLLVSMPSCEPHFCSLPWSPGASPLQKQQRAGHQDHQVPAGAAGAAAAEDHQAPAQAQGNGPELPAAAPSSQRVSPATAGWPWGNCFRTHCFCPHGDWVFFFFTRLSYGS